jgi:hypothetical protein
MTAASGVLHKEYHEKEFSRKGGMFQMVQLWVNLPAKFKMTPAKYQAILNEEMGRYISDDGNLIVEVIAGEYNGVKGPAFTFTPMHVFTAKLKKGAKADFSFPSNYNTGFLVIEGEVSVNGGKATVEDSFIYFERKGSVVSLIANADSTVLILSGEPIDEPIASYGPFVMNTEQEIKEAYEDFYNGKFGYLED